jgi:hypothetical protein
MQAKLSAKELNEELDKFKDEAIEILNPVNRNPKNLIKYKKIRNINYNAARVETMKKLEEICNQCYKNWDNNQGIIKAEPQLSDPFQYEPIRFSEPREISIPRYFSCTKNKEEEEAKLQKEKEKIGGRGNGFPNPVFGIARV